MTYIPTDVLREEAYFRLGVKSEEVHAAPQITPQLRMIAATIRREGQPKVTRKLIEEDHEEIIAEDTIYDIPYGPGNDLGRSWPVYLSASEEREAKLVMESYRSIPKYLQLLPIEAYCVAAGVSPIRILGILTATCVQMGAHASTIIAAVNHPRVVQKSIDVALTDEGIADRKMLHQATRFLPTSKGATTTITVQQNAVAQVANTSAPPPEATIRRMVDRFNDQRTIAARPQLEAQVTEPMPVPQPHAIAIEAEYDDEDE